MALWLNHSAFASKSSKIIQAAEPTHLGAGISRVDPILYTSTEDENKDMGVNYTPRVPVGYNLDIPGLSSRFAPLSREINTCLSKNGMDQTSQDEVLLANQVKHRLRNSEQRCWAVSIRRSLLKVLTWNNIQKEDTLVELSSQWDSMLPRYNSTALNPKPCCR